MKRLVVLIIFVLIGFGIYFNSFNNSYHYDDGHHIVNNPYIRTVGNIPLFFARSNTFSARPGLHSHYRPLVMVSYSLNYYLDNLHPRGFHMLNLGFHIGSAFLVFLILQAMLSSHPSLPLEGGGSGRGWAFIPFAAGLLFLTTPYNSEVVNYISTRSTVMCAFFYLLAFYFWVRYRKVAVNTPPPILPPQGGEEFKREGSVYFSLPPCGGGLGWGVYLASLLAFTLAMLSKEIAITLPVMLWLYDVYAIERPAIRSTLLNPRTYLPYLPFAVVGIFTGFILRILFFKGFVTSQSRAGMGARFLTEVKVLAKYFYNMAVPVQLSVEHKIQETANIYFFISLISLAGLIVLAYLLWRGRDPLWRRVSFFIAWFFIVLLPTTVMPLSQAYQENRGYLAMAGFMGIAVVGIDRLIKNILPGERAQYILWYSLLGILVILYASGTVQRNQVWLNDYTLWSDVLQKNPASPQAHIGLGNYYASIGQWERAEAEYRAHLEIDPEDSKALTNLGMMHLRKGEVDRAEELFKRSLEKDPYQITANYRMAKILQEKGDLLSAAGHIVQVLSVNPDNLQAATLLVDLYERMDRLDEAYGRVRMAEKEDPNNPAIKRALGLIYMKRDKWEAAARSYEMVLKNIPDDSKTLLDLGYVYSRLGLVERAEAKFRQALAVNPGDPVAYQTLGIIYQKQGRYDDALKLYQALLKASPNSFRVYNNLGLVYLAKGENEKAIGAFQKALKQTPSYHMARVNLARAYEEDGKKDLARREYQKVLKSVSPEGEERPLYITAQKRLAALQ